MKAKLDDDEFLVHWFVRQGKRKQFHALMEADGSPNTSAVSADAIMFWNIFENRQGSVLLSFARF